MRQRRKVEESTRRQAARSLVEYQALARRRDRPSPWTKKGTFRTTRARLTVWVGCYRFGGQVW